MELKLNQLELATALNFITGGNCTLTVKSLTSGNHFTFKVKQPKNKQDIWFVSALQGAEDVYKYFGFIRNNTFFYGGAKAKISNDPQTKGAATVMAFEKMFEFARNGRNHAKLELYHSGTCGRCGRKLTHPESLQTGLGPECAGRVGR